MYTMKQYPSVSKASSSILDTLNTTHTAIHFPHEFIPFMLTIPSQSSHQCMHSHLYTNIINTNQGIPRFSCFWVKTKPTLNGHRQTHTHTPDMMACHVIAPFIQNEIQPETIFVFTEHPLKSPPNYWINHSSTVQRSCGNLRAHL